MKKPPFKSTDLTLNKSANIAYKMSAADSGSFTMMNTGICFEEWMRRVHALHGDAVPPEDKTIIQYTISNNTQKIALSDHQDYVKFLERVAGCGKAVVSFFDQVNLPTLLQTPSHK